VPRKPLQFIAATGRGKAQVEGNKAANMYLKGTQASKKQRPTRPRKTCVQRRGGNQAIGIKNAAMRQKRSPRVSRSQKNIDPAKHVCEKNFEV